LITRLLVETINHSAKAITSLILKLRTGNETIIIVWSAPNRARVRARGRPSRAPRALSVAQILCMM